MSFELEWIQWIADHRTPLATAFFQAATSLGEIEGYILVVAVVYGAFDKRLAFRLAMVALVTMSINHVLKTIIANPRPFVAEGTYAQKWAVSEARAAELVAEYSTPSGHAMGGASFYTFLYASVASPWLKSFALAALLLTGISRPYLGVHYVEDVLIGWPIGIALALVFLRYGDGVGRRWLRLSTRERSLAVLALSALSITGTKLLSPEGPHGQPLPFVSYLGLLSGLALAYPLENERVGFDPRSSSTFLKVVRVVLGVALVIGTLAVLDRVFAAIAEDGSVLGYALRYLRYATAGLVGMFVAPALYVRLGLASGNAIRGTREP